jgi:outer membrane protein assembly factor BamB
MKAIDAQSSEVRAPFTSLIMHKLTAVILVLFTSVLLWASDLRQVGMVDLPGTPGFDEAAFAKGMLLISHATANTVEIFDPRKRRVIGKVSNLSQPHGIAVDEENGRVYIANSGANNLVVLSTSDFQVQRTIALPFSPRELLYVAETKLVYVVCPEAQRLLAVDPQLGTTTHTADTQAHPEYLAYDPGRDLVYVTLQDQKKIQAYQAAALEPVKSFGLQGSMPTGLAYDPQLDRLYVAIRNAVVELDAKTGSELGRVAAPTGTDRLWLDPRGRTLFAVSYGAVVLMHAGDRLTAAEELPIDVKGHAFAFDAKTGFLYLPGGREGRSKLLILKQQPGAP